MGTLEWDGGDEVMRWGVENDGMEETREQWIKINNSGGTLREGAKGVEGGKGKEMTLWTKGTFVAAQTATMATIPSCSWLS
jgi:hypothetical protein